MTIQVFHGVNHVFRHATPPNFFGDRDEVFSEEVSDYVVKWLQAHVSEGAAAGHGNDVNER